MRTLQRHNPSGETYVLEYDGDTITGISEPLHYLDWREPDGLDPLPGLDLWDFDVSNADADWANGQQWQPPILSTGE